MTESTEDRREALDRYNSEHDRAVAFLCCTPVGRQTVLYMLSTFKPLDDPPRPFEHQWINAEEPVGRGFVDVFAAGFWTVNGARTHRLCVCEVKTGKVIAGEVLRQLGRYAGTLKGESTKGQFGYSPETMLVLAHVQPLSIAASDLLARRGISNIDLSVSSEFAAYGRPSA